MDGLCMPYIQYLIIIQVLVDLHRELVYWPQMWCVTWKIFWFPPQEFALHVCTAEADP